LVFHIVALNVLTLRSLRDGYHSSPQIINKCDGKYEQLLSPTEIELVDWLTEDGGIHFDSKVSEFVTAMDRNEAMNYIRDVRTSAFYGQLLEISLTRYQAKQAHERIIWMTGDKGIIVPSEFGYCESYQRYVEELTREVRETKLYLTTVIDRIKAFANAIELAVNENILTVEYIEPLKSKLLAIRGLYADARTYIGWDSDDLFDPNSYVWQ
jgi:hypothetical protein